MKFSWMGVLVSGLVLAPNVLFMALPKRNMPPRQRDGGMFVNILEHGGRVLYFVLIIFTAESGVPALTRPFFYLAAVSLLIYYLLWSRYFLRGSDYRLLFEPVLRVPLPMAVFPVLSLLFAALWLQSIPSVIAGAAFAVGHLVNSYIAYKQNIKRA